MRIAVEVSREREGRGRGKCEWKGHDEMQKVVLEGDEILFHLVLKPK
jgi:hypothetical protein